MSKEITVLDRGFVRLIDHLGSDLRVVEAARVSYRSPSKGEEQDKKLLFYLFKNMHSSPFEQCSLTFNIKLPLFVQAQLVRHRMARLNQVSARYTKMHDDFYFPAIWRKQDDKNKQASKGEFSAIENSQFTHFLKEECSEAYRHYEYLVEQGVSREMARMILPQNLYTEIYWNIDLNNLFKFLNLRLDAHAQQEIREYAEAIYLLAKEVFPWSFEAFDKFKFQIVEREHSHG
jgi:thymidylate synthase (FAD)